ncbi:NXPE family member 3-like isoform X1 [Vanacampus margaritifer]
MQDSGSRRKSWKYHTVSPPYKVQNRNQSSNPFKNLPTFPHQRTFCPHLYQPLSTEEELEERNLLDSIAWPRPPSGSEPLNLSQTSDLAHSLFTIVTSQNNHSWYVGDQLEVQIHLHDFKGQPKRYGGDLLLARLHSPKYKAGVAREVLDHKNGLYSARFPLLWEGSAQVEVMMVHSNEAIAVLQRLREKRPDRVYFSSIFHQGEQSEKMGCNLCLPQDKGPLCNYTDLHTGDAWYCYKPKMLSCDTRNNHFMESPLKNIITNKEALLFQKGVNLKYPIHASTSDTIVVLPSKKGTVDLQNYNSHFWGMAISHHIVSAINVENGSKIPDPVKLATSGYYYQDIWRPLGGVTERQVDGLSITQCLANKLVYLYGDSTMRQWFEYLVTVLPGMKEFKQESTIKVGPFMALDSTHNILLKYHFHGPPIVSKANAVAHKIRYIANELDGLTGGPNTVVALSLWAHFSPFPVEVYIHRLRHIRKAVVRLLNRAPGTAVVVRTPNPRALDQELSLIFSDWFALQLDVVLRAMFKDLNVMLVDAWQMCVAHQQPHNVHPPRVIVRNMVDMMLSHVCRDGTTTDA